MPINPPGAPLFVLREARTGDIPTLMRLKLELAIEDGIAFTVRATAADWEREGFGPNARFIILVAEISGRVIGMAISVERYFPGWIGPTIALLDLCVEAGERNRGVGTALLQRVAELAKARGSVMIELTMRKGNRAAALYERLGFKVVTEIRNYVIAGPALDRLAVGAPALREQAPSGVA